LSLFHFLLATTTTTTTAATSLTIIYIRRDQDSAEIRAQPAKKMDLIWRWLQQHMCRDEDLCIEDEEFESFATKKELHIAGEGEPDFFPCYFMLLP
jgi:hypothetical protein